MKRVKVKVYETPLTKEEYYGEGLATKIHHSNGELSYCRICFPPNHKNSIDDDIGRQWFVNDKNKFEDWWVLTSDIKGVK